jgi:hypothetical protein
MPIRDFHSRLNDAHLEDPLLAALRRLCRLDSVQSAPPDGSAETHWAVWSARAEPARVQR